MRRGSRSVAVIALAVAVTACAPTVAPTVLPQATPTPSAAPATSSPPASSPSTATGAEVDPTLLDVLPAEVDGQALRPDAETAAEIAATGNLAPDVEAIAVGLYIQPGASAADDLAIVNVVRLSPGVFEDGWYR